MKKIKWGVIGTAGIARSCTIPGMQQADNCELYAIAGRNIDKAEQFKEAFGFEKAYGSYKELLDDPEVEARKENAILQCKAYNAIDDADYDAQYAQLKKMLGSIGQKVWIAKNFNCDNGKKIFIGNNFTGNYNLTILDIREVYIGDHVMIGPNTLITTVGHPLSPMGRRKHLGIAKPVHIGNDVWIGGNVTILPGITIGNNVVIAAGAVVTKDVPDNCLVGGVPAKKIKDIENDVL